MASHIGRRKFLATLGGAAAWPLAPRAQQPAGRLPRIGILYFGWNENIAAFLQGLRDGGYIDGQSAIIEARYYGTLIDRLPELAKDLVALNCDVIYAAAPYAIQAAMKATSTISIVGATWKAILWRAGGRGLSLVQAATLPERSSIFPNLAASRLSCLRMPSQGCRVWRFSGIPRSAACSFVPRRQRRAQRGSHCNSLPIQRAEDFNSAFDRAARERIDGMIVLSSPIIQGQRSEIAALALETHLPTISLFTVFPRFGALMAYVCSPGVSWNQPC